ncbi:MAG: hypothetical protein ACKOSO_10980, partial [Actinomycetota bacterium]
MAPVRHAAPGGGVEFELDPETGHAAWRVDGRRAGVQRARQVAGDASVDRILRAVVRELRARACAMLRVMSAWDNDGDGVSARVVLVVALVAALALVVGLAAGTFIGRSSQPSLAT